MTGQKYKTRTIEEKYKIIKYVEEHPEKMKKAVAQKFNIPPATLSTFLKNKERIAADHQQNFSSRRKRMRTSACPNVESALLGWFKQVRAAHRPTPSDLILLEKANKLAKEFGIDSVSASWISRFKSRHAIKSRSGHDGVSEDPSGGKEVGKTGLSGDTKIAAATKNEQETEANGSSEQALADTPAPTMAMASSSVQLLRKWLATKPAVPMELFSALNQIETFVEECALRKKQKTRAEKFTK
ncbi:major centromere autoantigen B-like [Carcharodon carcharias]|uniref:major centromere autoantigen B-like n=1 Tax=Carcharodon carcharias TaxID=13397 RepID=UPI001B7F1B0A|nr:major centromere autoantigen B-like [Carcharodon carcharias]